MRSRELEAVAGVWRRARIGAVPELEGRSGRSPEDDLRHLTEDVLPRSEIWVADSEGFVVGMMTRRGTELDKLYVDPGHQGRGIGSLLLEKAKHDSPAGLRLSTHRVNSRARAFYEANGFVVEAFGISPPPESEPDVSYVWRPGDA